MTDETRPRTDLCPDHVWEIEAPHLSARQADEIKALLPEAVVSGKEILVVQGVTVRRKNVAEAEAAIPDSRLRAAIVERARLQDAYDALRAAILWLHGEYRDTPRSQFNAEPWYRKARSGCGGLRDYLTWTDGPEPLADDVVMRASVTEYHEHVAGDRHSHAYSGPHSHGGVSALLSPKGRQEPER